MIANAYWATESSAAWQSTVFADASIIDYIDWQHFKDTLLAEILCIKNNFLFYIYL